MPGAAHGTALLGVPVLLLDAFAGLWPGLAGGEDRSSAPLQGVAPRAPGRGLTGGKLTASLRLLPEPGDAVNGTRGSARPPRSAGDGERAAATGSSTSATAKRTAGDELRAELGPPASLLTRPLGGDAPAGSTGGNFTSATAPGAGRKLEGRLDRCPGTPRPAT